MKLQGSHFYPHPRQLVFDALLDPEVLSRTLPGCEDLQKTGDNQYSGKLKMKVGPVQGVFQGKVQLLDINEPESYRLEIEGSGAPGFMNASGELRLEEQNGGTELHYDLDAKVGGKIASIGQRLVESSAKVITRQGLAGLEVQLDRIAAENGAVAAADDTQQAFPAESLGTEAGQTVSPATVSPTTVSPSTASPAPMAPTTEAAPPTGPASPAEPSQAEFAADFAKGMAKELLPSTSRWVLIAAPLLLLAIFVAVYLRTCA